MGPRLKESLNAEEEAEESVSEQYNVRLNWPLLALKTEGVCKPRNVGSLQKLEKAKNQSLP